MPWGALCSRPRAPLAPPGHCRHVSGAAARVGKTVDPWPCSQDMQGAGPRLWRLPTTRDTSTPVHLPTPERPHRGMWGGAPGCAVAGQSISGPPGSGHMGGEMGVVGARGSGLGQAWPARWQLLPQAPLLALLSFQTQSAGSRLFSWFSLTHFPKQRMTRISSCGLEQGAQEAPWVLGPKCGQCLQGWGRHPQEMVLSGCLGDPRSPHPTPGSLCCTGENRSRPGACSQESPKLSWQTVSGTHTRVHSPPGLPIQLWAKRKPEVEPREELGSRNPASYFGLSHMLVV